MLELVLRFGIIFILYGFLVSSLYLFKKKYLYFTPKKKSEASLLSIKEGKINKLDEKVFIKLDDDNNSLSIYKEKCNDYDIFIYRQRDKYWLMAKDVSKILIGGKTINSLKPILLYQGVFIQIKGCMFRFERWNNEC